MNSLQLANLIHSALLEQARGNPYLAVAGSHPSSVTIDGDVDLLEAVRIALSELE